MKELIVAKSYAQAIIKLGDEKGVDVADEFTRLNVVINESNALENLMFLDVFTVEEKNDVLSIVSEKLKLSPIVKNFVLFLLQEKRIHIFPLIFKEIIVLDDHKRGFLRGKIEGTDEKIADEVKVKIKNYIEKRTGQKTSLDYCQNENVTAGYKVTVEDLQLDASLDNQLNKFKETVLNV